MTTKVKCPTCQKETLWSDTNQYRPFCCHRCKLIDLGEWASENRAIPGPSDPLAEFDMEFDDTLPNSDRLH